MAISPAEGDPSPLGDYNWNHRLSVCKASERSSGPSPSFLTEEESEDQREEELLKILKQHLAEWSELDHKPLRHTIWSGKNDMIHQWGKNKTVNDE